MDPKRQRQLELEAEAEAEAELELEQEEQGKAQNPDLAISNYFADKGAKEAKLADQFVSEHPFQAMTQTLAKAIFGSSPRSAFINPTSDQIAAITADPDAPDELKQIVANRQGAATAGDVVGGAAYGSLMPWSKAAEGAGFLGRAGNLIKNMVPTLGLFETQRAGEEAAGEKPISSPDEIFSRNALASAFMGAPFLAKEGVIGGAKLLSGLGGRIPSEEAALGQAFGITPKDAAYVKGAGEKPPQIVLRDLKNNGTIVSPAESSTPFKDTFGNWQDAMKANRQEVTNILDESGALTTKDILPTTRDLQGITDAVENKALNSITNAEQDSIRKIAFSKNYPEADIEKNWKQYLKVKSKANAGGKGSKEAKALLNKLNAEIDNTEWTGEDIWKLRQAWDKRINFDAESAGARGDVYRGMRDNLQNKLLNLAGDSKQQLTDAFKNMSELFSVEPNLEKLSGKENLSLVGPTPPLQSLVSAITRPVKSGLGLITGHGATEDPYFLLKQAYGDTARQRLLAANPQVAGTGVEDPYKGLLSALYDQ